MIVVVVLAIVAVAYFVLSRPPASGTARMVERLQEVLNNIDPQTNPNANREKVEFYSKVVKDPAKFGSNKPVLWWRSTLAEQLFFVGRTKEAIEEMKRIQEEASKLPPEELAKLNPDEPDAPTFLWIQRDDLALAYLQLGEEQNCLANSNPDCCVFPVIDEPTGQREIHRVVGTGGCFGCNSLQQEIGLGQATKIAKIEIYWPVSKQTQVFENVEMDRIYRVKEGDDQLATVELKTYRLGGEGA